jgi:hypothetical protein
VWQHESDTSSCVSAIIRNGILRLFPSGCKSQGMLNWHCWEDKEEQCTPLLQWPPLSDTVMQEEDLIHFPFWLNSSQSLF